jgi:dTDP-4-dehydrorhamnose 3,5-epimerase
LQVIATDIPEILVIEPRVFPDDRGYFLETYQAEKFRAAGIDEPFVQDNHSHSMRGALRGLHYQEPGAQGKLVRCSRGSMWDVAVDIRVGSPTFGKWVGLELSEENKKMLWVPAGFAHGFCSLTDHCDVLYKCTTYYAPAYERGIAWNDPEIGIEWPISNPVLSRKDGAAPRLKDAAVLPRYRSS